MSEVIIFVDDLVNTDPDYHTGRVVEEIVKIAARAGRPEGILPKVLDGQRIVEALPAIEATIDKVDLSEHMVLGICIDVVDKKGNNIEAGAVLLEKLKRHRELKNYNVVMYTNLETSISAKVLIEKGAKGLARRRRSIEREGRSLYEDIAKQILDFLGWEPGCHK